MSMIDDAVKAAETYARGYTMGHLPAPPNRKLAVVTCMDARMMVDQMLGLKIGDAHIIRNAGGIVTDDTIRSLLISHYLLFTHEFMIINHTGCGLLEFKDDDLRRRLQETTGTATVAPDRFYSFTDLEQNVREQVQKVKSHPWVPRHIPVRGFVYDIKTARLSEVLG
jgi:carbonic anhydrase